MAVDVWSGPGFLSGTTRLSVAASSEGATTVTFSDLALDRGGTYRLQFSTVVVLANSSVQRLSVVTDPFFVTGACFVCRARTRPA